MGKKTIIFENGTTKEIELSESDDDITEYAFFDNNGEEYHLESTDKISADNYLLALQLLYLYRCKTLTEDDLSVYFDMFVKAYYRLTQRYVLYCIVQKHMDKVDYDISIYDIDKANVNIKKYLTPNFKKVSTWNKLNLEEILANFSKENQNLSILGAVINLHFDLMFEFWKNQPKDESVYENKKEYTKISTTRDNKTITFFYTDKELLAANFDEKIIGRIHEYYVDIVYPYPSRVSATVKKIICALFYNTLPKDKVYGEDESELYTVVEVESKRFNFDKYIDFLNTVPLDTILEIKEYLFDLHSKSKNQSKVRTKQIETFLSYIESRKEQEYINIYGEKINILKKYYNQLVENSTFKFYIGREIPQKQLNKAFSAFNINSDRDNVIGFHDTTLFNSGKAGLVFTNDSMYYRETMSPAEKIPYNEIQDIRIISDKNGKKIVGLKVVTKNGKRISVSTVFIDMLSLKQCLEELAGINKSWMF